MSLQTWCGFVFSGDRVIDVGSEWRTFSNDKATKDPSRVGDTQNPLLSDGDLSTMIGKVTLQTLNFTECFCVKYQTVHPLRNYTTCVFLKRLSPQLNLHVSTVYKMWPFRGDRRKGPTFAKNPKSLQCCGVTCCPLICCNFKISIL